MSNARYRIILLTLGALILPLVASAFTGHSTTPPIASALLPVPLIHPRILYYTEFADNSLGSHGEAGNVWWAIDTTHGTGYTRTNLTSYTNLASELPNHDIFLIIEQEQMSLSNLTSIVAEWTTPLNDFLLRGGILIVMDYWNYQIGGYGITSYILNETGLITFDGINSQTFATTVISAPSHPLADGVAAYTAPDGSIGFNLTTPANVIVESQAEGQPIVVHKAIDNGHVVLLGFDCYTTDPETDEILGNAIRLFQPPSAPVLSTLPATVTGFQVDLNWTAATDNLGTIDHYQVQASADAGFSIVGQEANVTTLYHAFPFFSNGTYYFRVRAIDNNTLVGAWSNVVSTYVEFQFTLPGIPGFPFEAIALGLLLCLSAVFVLRHRKQQQVSS